MMNDRRTLSLSCSVTDALLSGHYQRRRYREDAKGRWWDSRENLQVWSVEQVTEAETCIEREYYIDQGLTMRYKGGKVGGRRENRGSKDDVAYYPVEHLSPVFRYVLVLPPPFSSVPRARESVWKRARTLRHRRRPNCTTSAYYPSLNYSPLTAKIAPCLPQTLSSSTPQDSPGFLHRYIFSVNALRGSLFRPHRKYTKSSLIKYVNVVSSSFTDIIVISWIRNQTEGIEK